MACSILPGSDGEEGSATSAVKTYCTQDKASGQCQCSTSDPGLTDDTDYVDDCNTPAGGSECCYDINGDGETTQCDCRVPKCATDTDTGSCTCRYFDRLVVGSSRDNEEIVSGSCTSAICWKGADACECFSLSNTISDGEKVASCSLSDLPATRKCDGGRKSASSCNGLKWKQP
jgi:hypothetical protein